MNILKKLFIKNYQDTKNPQVRTKYGFVAGIFGIITNVILFAIKIFIGLIAHSIAIMADSFNNLSDAASSILTTAGFKLASKPPDKEHPYGHQRFEHVTALIIAVIMLVVGAIFAKSSVDKILNPTETIISIPVYIILAISIVMKIMQMCVYINFSKAIDSNTLKASSKDSRNDVITTFSVLISSILISTINTSVSIDGIFGLGVSIFIIVSSCLLLKETVDPLLGTKPDPELVKSIQEKLLSYNGILGIHDLMIHNYGPSNCFVQLHAEVEAQMEILEAHDLIDTIEREVSTELNIHLSIHIDPVQTHDKTVMKHKTNIENIILTINPELTIHDFRMTILKDHTHIAFDVEIPYGLNINKQKLLNVLEKEYSKYKRKYEFLINFDNK